MEVRKASSLSETAKSREISISRTYATTPQRLFDYFKDPLELAQWWGPDHFITNEVEVEARINGSYSLTMTGMGMSQRIIGAITEYEEGRTLAVQSQVVHEGVTILRSYFRIVIEEEESGARLTLVAKATIENEYMASALLGMYAGWNQSLQRLDDELQGRIDRTLVVLSGLVATAGDVYEYWVSPEKLAQWWAPKDFTTIVSDMDLGDDGGCIITMAGPGGEKIVSRIGYREIAPPKRLHFRRSDEGALDPAVDVLVLFDEMGPQTVVSMRFIFDSVSDFDKTVNTLNVKKGAEESLERLRTLLLV